MNQNRKCNVAEKKELVLANPTNKQDQTQQIQDDESSDRFLCMPSVPRPGVTSWSLVL